ncbi:MAG: hypothetical protein ACQEXO_16840 [Pseudomonadota bacterium]
MADALQRDREPKSWGTRQAAVHQWQQGAGAEQSMHQMANAYADLYQSLGVPVPAPVA